jgi:hypothetical protein
LEDLIRKYLVSSAIDIDTSLLETDFAIQAIKPDDTDAKHAIQAVFSVKDD